MYHKIWKKKPQRGSLILSLSWPGMNPHILLAGPCLPDSAAMWGNEQAGSWKKWWVSEFLSASWCPKRIHLAGLVTEYWLLNKKENNNVQSAALFNTSKSLT